MIKSRKYIALGLYGLFCLGVVGMYGVGLWRGWSLNAVTVEHGKSTVIFIGPRHK